MNFCNSHIGTQSLGILAHYFANKSHTRIICLQDQLARITKDSSLIVHSIVNELAIGGAQINDVQLTLRILQGLGPNYDIIFAAIRSHETLIT